MYNDSKIKTHKIYITYAHLNTKTKQVEQESYVIYQFIKNKSLYMVFTFLIAFHNQECTFTR